MINVLRMYARFGIVIAALCINALGMAPASASAKDAQTSALTKLSLYDGTWSIDTTSFATAYSTAHHEREVVRTSCWLSPQYFTCNQRYRDNHATLIVYSYDAKTLRYFAHFLNDGPINPKHSASGMELTLVGNAWNYSGPLHDPAGKSIFVRNRNTIRSPRSIDFEESYSLDGVHWHVMRRGHESKRSGGVSHGADGAA